MTTNTNIPEKSVIIALLTAWIKQRAGIDARNYISGWNDVEGRRAYRNESAHITQQRHDAETLLRYVETSQITAVQLLEGFRAYSGRLSLTQTPSGEWKLEYCTGQYFPTEYRAAVCAVLASALWAYYQGDYANDENAGNKIRAAFRRTFGKRIASRWFN